MSNYIEIELEETDYLYIQASQLPNAGNGLFTAIDILRHEIIAIFEGEILLQAEANRRAILGQDRYFINMLDGSIMDSMLTDCFAKYANDTSGTVHCTFKNNAFIGLNEEDKVCLIASHRIKAGDEIFVSYGKRYVNTHFR